MQSIKKQEVEKKIGQTKSRAPPQATENLCQSKNSNNIRKWRTQK